MADSLLPDDPMPDDRDAILNKWKDKTREEILEAKVNSDLFIKSQNARFDDLKKDYLELRDRHQASTELADLVTQIKESRASGNQIPDTQRETIPPAIKPEDIQALVQKHLADYQMTTKQQENFNNMQAKLKERYGENYTGHYKQRLDELGLTKEQADDMAKNQPSVFRKSFDLDIQPGIPQQSLPRSQRQTNFAPAIAKRDWNYYQEMKKNNPKMYLDPKIAIQMHDDAIALGADFGMPQD